MRLKDALAYLSIIAQLRKQYMFTAVLAADEHHRKKLAEDNSLLLTSICDTSKLKLTSATALPAKYCDNCGIDTHTSSDCPFRPLKRARTDRPDPRSDTRPAPSNRALQVCLDYNKSSGCKRSRCKFIHACSNCRKTDCRHPGQNKCASVSA